MGIVRDTKRKIAPKDYLRNYGYMYTGSAYVSEYTNKYYITVDNQREQIMVKIYDNKICIRFFYKSITKYIDIPDGVDPRIECVFIDWLDNTVTKVINNEV